VNTDRPESEQAFDREAYRAALLAQCAVQTHRKVIDAAVKNMRIGECRAAADDITNGVLDAHARQLLLFNWTLAAPMPARRQLVATVLERTAADLTRLAGHLRKEGGG